jgi:hypothetical protein
MLSGNKGLSLITLALVAGAALARSSDVPTAVGKAYDQDSGILLYTEYHFCPQEAHTCTVQYRGAAGAMIAEKTLDYSSGPFSPTLKLIDYRLKREWSVPANQEPDVVVDAGFDNYMRSIWRRLELGERVRFPFRVTGFSKPIKMRADPVMSVECPEAEFCVEVGLDSMLLGILTSPIALTYSRESRRLLRFRGVSNLKGPDGEALHVDIRYQYDTDMHAEGTPAASVIRF